MEINAINTSNDDTQTCLNYQTRKMHAIHVYTSSRGAFCNTFYLHLATICHKDLYFVYFPVVVLHRFSCICMLGNISFFCYRLLTVFKIYFFQNTLRVSKGLDPDQMRCSVGSDLSPN